MSNAHAPDPLHPAPHRAGQSPGFERVLLRLVKGGPERQAIDAGEIDAIVDRDSGRAILLPDAQRAVMKSRALLQSLVALCSDWSWEQDEHYRFVRISGEGPGYRAEDHVHMIGRTLFELPIDNLSGPDWQMLRYRLDWRASFHDLELRHLDASGETRYLSLNGEPVFDDEDCFKGYHGSARDISNRKRAEAAAEASNRCARVTLDALDAGICVLEDTGTVILANRAWTEGPAGGGIAARTHEGASYLAACDHAPASERLAGAAVAAGIRRVIAGDLPRFESRTPGNPATGEREITLVVTPYHGHGVGRVVLTRTAIHAAGQAASADVAPGP
jgi:PAS domain S-box-containing protein